MAERKRKNLVQQIVEKLSRKGGMSAEKAEALAKDLAPVARKALKEEAEAKVKKEVKKAAVVEKSSLPVRGQPKPSVEHGEVVPMGGAVGAELLQRVMGRTTGPSYVVAAVRGEEGIVAVKKLHSGFKVKFYPTMDFWNLNRDRMGAFGASDFLRHQEYERMIFTNEGFAHLNELLIQESAGKLRVKNILKRFKVAVVDAINEVLSDPVSHR